MPDPIGHVEWLGKQASAECTERSFILHRPAPVPGVLWSPQATAPQATVLLFHGGSGHKRTERHLQMGRRLASEGLAAVAIDGPYHGDRVTAPMAPSAFQRLIADEGIENVTARMTEDWLEALSALADLGLADDAHVSVFGMSMGTPGPTQPTRHPGRTSSASTPHTRPVDHHGRAGGSAASVNLAASCDLQSGPARTRTMRGEKPAGLVRPGAHLIPGWTSIPKPPRNGA